MTTQTFIFVHNQKIILDYIKINKFNSLDNLKFVFVGDGDISEIKGLSNTIICNDLPINIEKYPKLTSFTGWYAIWKNKLYSEDFINLFEYDINLSFNFNEIINNNLNSDTNIIGYIPFNPHHHDFLNHLPWSSELIISIKDILDKDDLNENEYKLGLALSDIFENYETIFPATDNNKFNKNFILLSLREITNMSTKEIRASMKKFKKIYHGLISPDET
jgi:hypothetical protein